MLGFGETARLTSVVPSGGIDVLEREREQELEMSRFFFEGGKESTSSRAKGFKKK